MKYVLILVVLLALVAYPVIMWKRLTSNGKRLFLYLFFAIYQICAFIFTIMVDGRLDLLALLKYIPLFKYLSFIGLTLLAADFAWYWIERRNSERRRDELEKENIQLKARLYDLEGAARKEPTPKDA